VIGIWNCELSEVTRASRADFEEGCGFSFECSMFAMIGSYRSRSFVELIIETMPTISLTGF
jgi:hypothetical protein